jgi:hypothetical protein
MPSNVVLNVAQSVPIQMGNSASNVAAGDVNGDNKADLVVLENAANAGSGVEVLVSNGDGTFQKGKFYPEAAASTGGFALGRFTGSARFDIAIDSFDNASVDNFVDILPSTGGGALGTPVSSNIGWENVFTLRVGDLNGDGKPDLVFTDQGTSGGDSGYALNSGGGMFGSSVPLSLKGDGYALGDVTGDNVADIVQVEDTSVCVYVNDGKGQLPAMGTCYPSVAQTMPDTIALGDIDGDKLNDVIAVYMGDSGVANGPNIDTYLNKGKGVLGTAQAANLPFILSNVQLVDVNNDNKADIVGFNSYSSGIVQVLLGKGDGTFAATPASYPAGSQSGNAREAMAIADFAGNGLRGIAVPNGAKGTIDVMNATCKQ